MALPLSKPSLNMASSGARADPHATTREGIAQFIRAEYERRLAERRPFEQQWMLNLAYIDGQQYAEIHPTTGEVYVPDRRYEWEVRDAFNNVAPIYETRVAKLIRNRPIISVLPGSPDEEDISTAKIAKRLIEYNMDALDFESLLAQAIAWSEATGTAFVKNIWDPQKGPRVPDPQEGGDLALGDIDSVVCSPFEILPDNILEPSLEKQRSLIHAKAYPIDSDHVQALVERYRMETGEDFVPSAEDVSAVTVGKELIVRAGVPLPQFTVTNLRNHVVVIEYYELPSRRYPTGRFGILINKALMHFGPLPYQEDRDFPFSKIDCIRRPNCFWSKSVVERLIPVQRRYNALRNRVAEYLNRVGIGQWTAEEGTVDIDTLTNEPGLVVEYQRNARAPQPVVIPPLPSTFQDELEALMNEFHTISGVHEVSHGQLPQRAGSSPSGTMIAQLQEQDDTRIGTTQHYINSAVARIGRQWLLRYKEFLKEQRYVPIIGKNNTVHMLAFNRNSIRSYNVRVAAGSALANAPGARRDMVIQLLDRGLFNDPETGKLGSKGIKKVFELLEFGTWEDYDEDISVPTNRAEWENHLMSQGKPIPVFSWEKHEIHLHAHDSFRQTEDFYKLLATEAGPMIASIFEQHVRQHQAYIQQGQMANMMASDPLLKGASPVPPMGAATMTGATPAASPAVGSDMAAIAAQASRIEAEQGPEAAEAFLAQT